MTEPLSSRKKLARRTKSGFLNSAGKGGPWRLIAITVAVVGMVGLVIGLSIRSEEKSAESQVAKMKPMNLLPGGLQSTPAQEKLRIKHADAEAEKARTQAASYTPAMPGSKPLQAHEVGLDAEADPLPAPQPAAPPPVRLVMPGPPPYTPPAKPIAEAPPETFEEQPKIIKVAATTSETADDGAITPERRRAYERMMAQWDVKPMQTTVVIPPARGQDERGESAPGAQNGGRDSAAPATATNAATSATAAHKGKVLVPAGRGVYAHTVLAVNSDSGGPIVLEADTGPLMGDRMIGTFSKAGNDRLVVHVATIEHRGQTLEVSGLVLAPDSMETSVASKIDQHYLERFAMPAAAAFIQGLGQAAAMSNTVSSVSPYGTVTSQISPMSVSQQAWVGAGAAAQAVGKELTQTTPKGPTIYLEANIGVGVMFMSDVTEK